MFFRNKKTALLLLSAVMLGLLFQSCKTQRERRELSGVGKFYHNMTSHYNGYFNANELYEQSELLLSEQHQDNYTQILPVYPYQAVGDAEAVKPQLDLAIEKLSTVIGLHRGSNWEDDSYLLIGQSQYMKQDYESAQKTLEYLSYEFDPGKELYQEEYDRKEARKQREEEREERLEELEEKREEREKERKQLEKERKKERKRIEKERERRRKEARKNKKRRSDNRNDKGKEEAEQGEESGEEKKLTPAEIQQASLEDTEKEKEEEKEEEPESNPYDADNLPNVKDAYPRTLLWLARTYTERDMFTRAMQNFEELDKFTNLDKDVIRQIHPAKAHFHINREEYQQAAAELAKAIEVEPKNHIKARYAFILGQIQERLGAYSSAIESYALAGKWTDDYEMAFNARLKGSTAEVAGGGTSPEEVLGQLEKMLRDDKNKGFEDRIYYQMGQIYLDKGKIPEAEEMFLKALSFRSDNSATLTESYYALGNIYLEAEEYIKAKNYFDSTLLNMVENDIRYVEVKRWSSSLTEVATHLATLKEQDSLLAIANMSPEEKKALAAQLLEEKKAREREEKRKESIAESESTAGPNYIPPKATTSDIESSFFAYNERALRKGYREFRQRFEDRPRVDQWRRSAIIEGEPGDGITDAEIAAEKLSNEEVDNVLKSVPSSSSAIEQSESKVHDALFGLGVAFREDLENYGRSNEAFERLVDEYPNSEKRAESYYYLYLNYQDIDNFAKGDFYFNKLQEEFPESVYAQVLKDPDYLASLSDKEKQLVNYYDETYVAFLSDRHEEVLQRADRAGEIYDSKSPFLPKLELLRAMSIGKLRGKEAYKESLRDMIARYPGTAEQVRAKEILRFLQGDDAAFVRDDVPETYNFDNFRVDNDRLHYVIAVLYNEPEVGIDNAKNLITDFNASNFKNDHLRVTHIYLDEAAKIPVIVIRKFDNADDAMRYYDKVQAKSSEFLPPLADYELFAVNQRNYREVIKSHSTAAYNQWFMDTYLRNR